MYIKIMSNQGTELASRCLNVNEWLDDSEFRNQCRLLRYEAFLNIITNTDIKIKDAEQKKV